MKRLLLIVVCVMLAMPIVHGQDVETTPEEALSAEEQEPNPADFATIATLEAIQQDVQQHARIIELRSEHAEAIFDYWDAISIFLTIGGVIFGAAGIFSLRQLSNAKEELDSAVKKAGEVQKTLDAIKSDAQNQGNQIANNRKNLQLANNLQSVAENQHRFGDLEGALAIYDRVLAIDPENLWALYMKGYILTKKLQFSDALEILEKALIVDSEFYYALATRGFVKRRIGEKYDDELAKLELQVDRDEHIASRDKYFEEARIDLETALEAVHNLVDADGESWWGALGGLYKRQGNLDMALSRYGKAAKVTPTSSYPAINLAILELHKGDEKYKIDFSKAATYAKREVDAAPEAYWPYGDLVIAYLVLNRTAEAEKRFDDLISLIPTGVKDVLPRINDTLTQAVVDLRKLGEEEQATAIEKFISERLAKHLTLS